MYFNADLRQQLSVNWLLQIACCYVIALKSFAIGVHVNPTLKSSPLAPSLNTVAEEANSLAHVSDETGPPMVVDLTRENYEDKWNNLRELVNKTIDDLQTFSIQAQEQALRNWFNKVVKGMKVVELKRSIKQLPEKVVIKSLNLEDPEDVKLIEKLQEDMLHQKMVFEDLKRQLAELKGEQKQQRIIQEAQIRKS